MKNELPRRNVIGQAVRCNGGKPRRGNAARPLCSDSPRPRCITFLPPGYGAGTHCDEGL